MRIVFVGQGKWSKHLADALNRTSGERLACTHWSIDTPRAVLSLRNFGAAMGSDVLVRVGFRPGARSLKGWCFDALWVSMLRANRKARPFIYWIGSDVSDALHDLEQKRRNRRLESIVNRARSIAGSDRLTAELATAGIVADNVPFPGGFNQVPETVAALPTDFSVLTYVPDGRFEFYGGPSVISAAKALPSVRFLVVGGLGTWATDVPSNLQFLGWRDDMPDLLEKSSAVVRMVRHDSFGGTAGEALMYARHLIYSYELPFSTYVEFGDELSLIAALSKLSDANLAGTLAPNREGREWILSEFDQEARLRHLQETLTNRISPMETP
ncbi:MAG: hypothetical protein Q7V01_14960 [Vicinamibacterales bacterium]|nr:hypothetical protein [Vicinamibacterales bacterium]